MKTKLFAAWLAIPFAASIASDSGAPFNVIAWILLVWIVSALVWLELYRRHEEEKRQRRLDACRRQSRKAGYNKVTGTHVKALGLITGTLATAAGLIYNIVNSVCGHLNEAEALNRKLQTENEKLRAEMEQVKRERDTAIEQLHGICDACQHYTPYHNRGKCASCEHEIVRDPKIPPVDNWEWRGPKEG